MGLAHEKKSYLQEKANLFEIGSYHKDSEMSIPILLFFEKKSHLSEDCDDFRNPCLEGVRHRSFRLARSAFTQKKAAAKP